MSGRGTNRWARLVFLAAGALCGCSGDDAAAGSGGAGTPNVVGPVAGAAGGAGAILAGTDPVGTAGVAGDGTAGTAGGVAGDTSGAGAAGAGAAVADPAAGGSAPQTGELDCTLTPTLTMSPVIGTVGIVEFTTDLGSIDEAFIEFGLDTSYGMTAPVDLAEPGHRTLLLGMKTSREYHYRIVAMSGGQRCTGTDNVLQTGPPPNQPRLPNVTIDTPQPDKLDRGFTVAGIFMAGPAFILDGDRDYVWWYDSGDVARARMSYDGKYMWIRNVNVAGGAPKVLRVSMDGMQVDAFDIDSEFVDGHHDFTVLPDESVVFIAHDSGGCDKIMERTPDGQSHEIINAQDAHGSSNCHVNSVHYLAQDDTITWSDLNQNCYVKMTRSGEVLWVMGGAASDFQTGTGAVWNRQHGHHVLAPDRMLMFENGGVGQRSKAYELVLDPVAGSVNRVWEYDGGHSSFVLGDVQRLSNGNTLVVYTTDGVVHEVDPDGNLVQSMTWALGGAVTYAQRRDSLHGPPPR